jgi:glycosyltransferase 2 family protein
LRTSLPEWMNALKAVALPKRRGLHGRLKGLGIIAGIAIAVAAIFALAHILKHIDYAEVLEAVRRTHASHIVLALMLVAISYGSLTLYDVLALRTIERTDIPYRIAALASFTSYPIAHGVGAVSLISPVIRYRIYSWHGLGVVDVANICFLTGLTFWLGNLTALALSLLAEPGAISHLEYLTPPLTRWLAVALLLGIVGFLLWSWLSPRSFGNRRWSVRLPSGPVVLLQIAIGIVDLGAAALAMYVLIPGGMNIGIFRVTAVFIAAILLGFASHAPAGIGVFDATILIGLGDADKEPLIAALLVFRCLYHLLPFVTALGLLGVVEAMRVLRGRNLP